VLCKGCLANGNRKGPGNPEFFWLLFLFTLAVTLATLVGEAFKTHLIGYLRFADFEDMEVGILYGLWEAIAFLEGQKLYLVPLVMLGLGTVWVVLWRQSRLPFSTFMKSGPVTTFMVGLLVIPVGLLLWFLLTGGWCEPSQFFLGRCK